MRDGIDDGGTIALIRRDLARALASVAHTQRTVLHTRALIRADVNAAMPRGPSARPRS